MFLSLKGLELILIHPCLITRNSTREDMGKEVRFSNDQGLEAQKGSAKSMKANLKVTIVMKIDGVVALITATIIKEK